MNDEFERTRSNVKDNSGIFSEVPSKTTKVFRLAGLKRITYFWTSRVRSATHVTTFRRLQTAINPFREILLYENNVPMTYSENGIAQSV